MGTRHQLENEHLRVLSGEVELDSLSGYEEASPGEATFGPRGEVAARLLCLERSVAALFSEAEEARRTQESVPVDFVGQISESQRLHAKLKKALAASADVLAQSAELVAQIRGKPSPGSSSSDDR